MNILFFVHENFEQDLISELEIKKFPLQNAKRKAAGLITAEFDRPFEKLRTCIPLSNLIFGRQVLFHLKDLRLDGVKDRVAKIIEAIQESELPEKKFSGFFVETTDAETVKELTKFCKSLTLPLSNRLNREKMLPKGKNAKGLPFLHVILISQNFFILALTDPRNHVPHSSGLRRLKRSASQVSRSYLKLEDAITSLFTYDEQKNILSEGSSAIDLGAAPGGWTQFLAERGVFVTAIDGAQLDESISNLPNVKHLPFDGLTYRPKDPTTILTCDIVESPLRVAHALEWWFENHIMQFAVINFKLPMKSNRIGIILQCISILQRKNYEYRCKHLYSDREEVTLAVKTKD